jgi:hypothetical protein
MDINASKLTGIYVTRGIVALDFRVCYYSTMNNTIDSSTYRQMHPRSCGIQVQPQNVPPTLMNRLRKHCKANGTLISYFIVKALEAALDAAEKKAGKR